MIDMLADFQPRDITSKNVSSLQVTLKPPKAVLPESMLISNDRLSSVVELNTEQDEQFVSFNSSQMKMK